jgi:SAM-dependent methyltransferase
MGQDRFDFYTQKDNDFFTWRTEHPYLVDLTRRPFDIIWRENPKAVLEVGCGDGIALKFVSPIQYVGLDASWTRLQIASVKYKKYEFIQADGSYLPFQSGQFDLVFCSGTLHHIPKGTVFKVIQEMSRVCKPGGLLAIIEPNAYNPSMFLFGLIRRRERGILHCKANLFLGYLKKIGMDRDARVHYLGNFTPFYIIHYIFMKTSMIRSKGFLGLWKWVDSVACQLTPRKYWTGMVVTARKKTEVASSPLLHPERG